MKYAIDAIGQAVDHKLSNIQHSLNNDILPEIEAVRKKKSKHSYLQSISNKLF